MFEIIFIFQEDFRTILKSEIRSPYAIGTFRIKLTTISFQFRVCIVKTFMRTVFVRLSLMRQTENCSQYFQQKRAFLFNLIFLTSFTERLQNTSFSIFASTVFNKKSIINIEPKSFFPRISWYSYPLRKPSIFSKRLNLVFR